MLEPALQRSLHFAKYEGLGNDFIVLDVPSRDAISQKQAVALCDRHRGIGADGVLLVIPSSSYAASMVVINADGSIPEMCGNGLRCVALHLNRTNRAGHELTVQTDAGARTCTVTNADKNEVSVEVDMGEVRDLGNQVVFIDEKKIEVAVATAGNPHAILIGNFTRDDAERIGPRIEKDPAFEHGTNVEFAAIHGNEIDLLVWERGVGITLACGTGACATAVVAKNRRLVEGSGNVVVRLLGGELIVKPDPHARTYMIGPARFVFEGHA